MPEGDTVWNTARMLAGALEGQRLTGSDFRVPQLATMDLSGWLVRESTSRGKHLLLRLAGPDGERAYTLHSHLRMDGAWRVYRVGERWGARPTHLIRVVLRTESEVAVGYHLHDLALVPASGEAGLVGHLGPDLLGADWDAAEAARRLHADPARQIADALLDQRNLAGIGNIYKNEVLYLCGVWPWTPVEQVANLPALVEMAHRLLSANRGRQIRSTTGVLRPGQSLHVYARPGQRCRRCGSGIRRAGQGERITFWCPRCQPEPAGDRPD